MGRIQPVPNPTRPYWLSEPHELSNLRSTVELPSECDIVIIGSGMSGITTAYHLLKENTRLPSIVLLEARELCSGATGRNGGHCKVPVPMLAALLHQLGPCGVDGFQTYVHGIIDGLKQLVEEEELDCEFELRRSFDVQMYEEESKHLKEIFEKCRKAGHNWTKTVGWVDPSRLEQVTSVKNATSAFTVPACSFWPYKLVTQLLARLVVRHPDQLNVQTNTPVTDVQVDDQGMNIISTPRGTIRAKKMILATNGYTAGLLPQFENIIVPVRGMASHIIPRNPVFPHLQNTYNICFGPEKGFDYLNPRPDGSVVLGGAKWLYKSDLSTWYNNFDDSAPFAPEIENYFSGYMQRHMLGWADSGAFVDNVWVGIMGITSDGRPHVGRVPGTKNQWILAGFDGAGMLIILTAAKAIARMVREDLGFDDVKKDYKLPTFFATSMDRLGKCCNGLT